MFNFDNDESQGNKEEQEFEPDTRLTSELNAFLQQRKEDRLNVVSNTNKILQLSLSWSMNVTGYFLARSLLLLGGSFNYWLAVTLCFSCCSVIPLSKLTGFRINYGGNEGGGLQVDSFESVLKGVLGLTGSAITTFLAQEDYRKYQALTNQSINEINHDIYTFEKQSPQNPIDFGVVQIVLVILAGISLASMFLFKDKKEK